MLPEAVAKDFRVPYLPSNESSRSPSRSSGLPHTLRVPLRSELYASWLIGIFFVLSAWLGWPSDFKRAGRSKLAWMAITLLGLIPYVGFIPALVYFFRVYRHLPNDVPGQPAKKFRARRPTYRTVATGRSIPCSRCPNNPGRVVHVRCAGSGTVPGRGMFREPCGCGNGTVIGPVCEGKGVVPEYARQEVTAKETRFRLFLLVKGPGVPYPPPPAAQPTQLPYAARGPVRPGTARPEHYKPRGLNRQQPQGALHPLRERQIRLGAARVITAHARSSPS